MNHSPLAASLSRLFRVPKSSILEGLSAPESSSRNISSRNVLFIGSGTTMAANESDSGGSRRIEYVFSRVLLTVRLCIPRRSCRCLQCQSHLCSHYDLTRSFHSFPCSAFHCTHRLYARHLGRVRSVVVISYKHGDRIRY